MPDDPEDESGPYCRHWDEPSECVRRCAKCGKECRIHGGGACEWKEEVFPSKSVERRILEQRREKPKEDQT